MSEPQTDVLVRGAGPVGQGLRGAAEGVSMILAGDVGGTKTDLAVFSPERGLRAPLAQERFTSDEYPSLEAIAGQFLTRAGL